MKIFLVISFVFLQIFFNGSHASQEFDFSEAEAAVEAGDYEAAFTIYMQAAKAGNSQACGFVGLGYLYGRGVEKNEQKAAYWLKKSAEQGNPFAQELLGALYVNGVGVEKNMKEAVYWLEEASERGSNLAQVRLGKMYSMGMGVIQDDSKAVEYYRKSATNGFGQGQVGLAYAYLLGRGVEKNKVQAYVWASVAVYSGEDNNLKYEIEKELSGIELAVARNFVKQCISSSFKECDIDGEERQSAAPPVSSNGCNTTKSYLLSDTLLGGANGCGN